jgi:dolichol-phosphate mannosyltransferase
VGASGLAVNLLLLTAFLAARVPQAAAIACAIILSMTWNFALNRRFTFSYARHEPAVRQFMGFASASTFGAVVNYLVTMWLWDFFHYNQIAAAIGVISGTAFNFVGSRYVIFRKRHVILQTDPDAQSQEKDVQSYERDDAGRPQGSRSVALEPTGNSSALS